VWAPASPGPQRSPGSRHLGFPAGRGGRRIRSGVRMEVSAGARIGRRESGYRDVIALDVGEAETKTFWRSSLRSLVERGLTGVQLG
jgi:Transposase, Mutator family